MFNNFGARVLFFGLGLLGFGIAFVYNEKKAKQTALKYNLTWKEGF